jgi:flagellar biosynthetic protein FliP
MLFIKTLALSLLLVSFGYAQEQILPNIELKVGTGQLDTSIRLLILLTVLSLAPSILIMTTSFVRIVIVLSLIRQALGVPTVPPNQVIVSLALFLTFFIMKPVFESINQNALQPLLKREITDRVFFERTSDILKEFMAKHTRKESIKVFFGCIWYEQRGKGKDQITKRYSPERADPRLYGKRNKRGFPDSLSAIPTLF